MKLSKWISHQSKKEILNDFYVPVRDYDKRYKLYEHVIKTENLANEAMDYLEFGVSGAYSFKWWINANKSNDSRFYGFDTFEGLPENWGTFKKGDMHAAIPAIDDSRHEFVKGLFQQSLYPFLDTHSLNNGKRKIIHLDADLYSSTLFVLTTLARHLKKDDILLFDEFNVPNHEFFAFKCFTDSYYIKYKLIGAANNYYQVAIKII
ncbi:MAG: class I SAM-dependent methyltransferase [Bacteroidia bacterium]